MIEGGRCVVLLYYVHVWLLFAHIKYRGTGDVALYALSRDDGRVHVGPARKKEGTIQKKMSYCERRRLLLAASRTDTHTTHYSLVSSRQRLRLRRGVTGTCWSAAARMLGSHGATL